MPYRYSLIGSGYYTEALKSLRFAIPTKLSTLEASKPLIEGVSNRKPRTKLPAVPQHRRCSTGSSPPRSAKPLWSHSQGLHLKPSSEAPPSPATPRRLADNIFIRLSVIISSVGLY